jgi:hypothetical protein
MLVKIEELRKGDEILVPAGSTLLYLRLLQDPKISKKLGWDGAQKYSSIKCSLKVQTVEHKNYDGVLYYRNITECSAEGHNFEKYYNLNHKTIWRVKVFY